MAQQLRYYLSEGNQRSAWFEMISYRQQQIFYRLMMVQMISKASMILLDCLHSHRLYLLREDLMIDLHSLPESR